MSGVLPVYSTRATKHARTFVLYRGQWARLHGEPLCGMPPGPGATTRDDEAHTCAHCRTRMAAWNLAGVRADAEQAHAARVELVAEWKALDAPERTAS